MRRLLMADYKRDNTQRNYDIWTRFKDDQSRVNNRTDFSWDDHNIVFFSEHAYFTYPQQL